MPVTADPPPKLAMTVQKLLRSVAILGLAERVHKGVRQSVAVEEGKLLTEKLSNPFNLNHFTNLHLHVYETVYLS